MDERIGEVENNGICRGLDEANFAETHAAGNAVVPQVAHWIAELLKLEKKGVDLDDVVRSPPIVGLRSSYVNQKKP